jgi:hypothetical protein
VIRAPAIFLRAGSILPYGLGLRQRRFDKAWMVAEDVAPAHLDLAVRNAGWHFTWIDSACCRRGCGRTDEAASRRAIARALSQTEARFNAAELGVVRVSRWWGVRVAKATLYTRNIQQNRALGSIDELTLRRLAPK